MGLSATTGPLPIGSHKISTEMVALQTAAGLEPWLRNLLDRCAEALTSDWLVAVLIIGVALNVADPWHGYLIGGGTTATGGDNFAWIHNVAGCALTSASVLSAFLMVLQKRVLLAARRTIAALPDTASGSEAAPDRDREAPEPAFHEAADRPDASCDAAVRAAEADGWLPAETNLACRPQGEPESGQGTDNCGPSWMPAAHAERMQALGQLAAGIAHDFNNLLSAIQGTATLITHHADDPVATRRYAGMILDATTRGQSITRRLLGFARRDEVRPEPVDPRSVLHALHEIASHTLGSLISVRVEAAGPLPRLMAERGQLETALVNLAVNARDAMPAGGTLTFGATLEVVAKDAVHPGVRDPGPYIRISVSDTGTGIDEPLLARVYEPFFTTKPPGRGTGLGLPMTKAFAEHSGGALTIDSSPGRGTTVNLWLPVADEPPPAPAALASKRVLLAEDDPMVSETLAAVLEDAGYAVALAGSGAEALALLRTAARVDALVTDLSIRELGGLALIDGAHRCRPGLPAILLTACPDIDAALAMKGAFSGAFSLLRKPVSTVHLVARIEALIAAAEG